MESTSDLIHTGMTDPAIHQVVSSTPGDPSAVFTMHVNQNEEFFLLLEREYSVPSLPIHHDVRNPHADPAYTRVLKDWLSSFLPMAPPFFSELRYFFDPSQILKPSFYKIYRIDSSYYLYVLRLDLNRRPMESRELEAGDNDTTSAFATRRLYMESEFIPLEGLEGGVNEARWFTPKQLITRNYLGETGRGYFVHGIWIDTELGKFITRLVLPKGLRNYPFYPFISKYKSVCLVVPNPLPEQRRALLPYLHKVLDRLKDFLPAIQQSLQYKDFSEDLLIFQQLKARWPTQLGTPWGNLKIETYLNENEQKEFRVVLQD